MKPEAERGENIPKTALSAEKGPRRGSHLHADTLTLTAVMHANEPIKCVA